MTLTDAEADIRRRLAEIAEHGRAGDYEAAHSDEDALFYDFIETVRDYGPPELARLAALVLGSRKLDFARHCA